MPSSSSEYLKLVLDTNVCLDLFVFHDPRYEALVAALTNGTVKAFTRVDCRNEWKIVLHYPHLPLNEQSREIAASAYDHYIECLPLKEASTDDVKLPICKDTDDQKFLEIARDAHAEILLTKDNALLKLAKRAQKLNLFRILTPDAWLVEFKA